MKRIRIQNAPTLGWRPYSYMQDDDMWNLLEEFEQLIADDDGSPPPLPKIEKKFSQGDRVLRKGRCGTVREVYDRSKFGEVEYYLELDDGSFEYASQDELVRTFRSRPYEPSCECGAWKTYGKKCSGLHHALWCRLRSE